MHPEQGPLVGVALLVVLVLAPLSVGILGWSRTRREPPGQPVADRIAIATSFLLYIVAFNVAFFVQELFLVVPKALTPGLEPVLYHNNHSWRGSHPLENLFQGTGALATLLMALACALVEPRVRATAARWLLWWLAYCGAFMALPQFVVAALSPGSDVGRALDFFGLSQPAKLAVAFVALVAMPVVAIALGRRLPALAPRPLDSARARARFTFAHAFLPATLAIAPIIAYRVPREWVEVVFLPVVVAFVGLPWMQAMAWRAPAGTRTTAPLRGAAAALVAALAILAIFQLVLRPGIRF
jgi:hypothetical protein